MPTPTPTYSWEHAINIQLAHGGDTGDRNRLALYRLKNAMIGGETTYNDAGDTISMSAPFVVVASSNGSSAGAADNWASISDVNFANNASAHSWIHLRLVDYFGSGDHLNLLIDCIPVQATEAIARLSWARGSAGFNNDGTTTTRPTLQSGSTEIVLKDGTATAGDGLTSDMLFGIDGTSNDLVLHFQISDDGQAGRWFAFNNGAVVAFFGWQRDEDGPSRTHDFFVWGNSSDTASDVWVWTSFLQALAFFRSLTNAGVEFGAYASGFVFTNTHDDLVDMNLSTFNSRRWMGQCLIGSPSGTIGVHSVLSDLWWGRGADANGEGGPAAGATFRKVGHMLTPWPAGQAMLTT